MNQDPENRREDPDRLTEPDYGPAPNRLTWPLKRVYWSFEKHVLWPVADTFRRKPDFSGAGGPDPYGSGRGRRSPLVYVGVTMLVALAGGATAAAVYFHNQANEDPTAPVVAEVPATPDTTVAPTPAVTAPAPEAAANQEETLQGVVPQFEKSAGETASANSGSTGSGSDGAGSGGNAAPGSGKKKPKALVNPAPAPESGPLKVAHNFARTFTGYEIGRKGAARKFASTSTAELAKELRQNPPKQPAGTEVPRATVMNVVRGQKEGRMLLISVSLRRSGATSELRLGLKQAGAKKKKNARDKSGGWRVSEVRG